MTPASRRPGAVVLLLVLAMSGCGISLPDEGPVVDSQTTGNGKQVDAMTIDPLGPQPLQSPSEVVKGFLDAMQATPIRDDVAREFLTTQSQATWKPDATIVYDDISLPQPSPQSGELVDVNLTGADEIDDRGSWQGATDNELRFAVEKVGDDYRIALPSDTLIVPRSWYTQRFRQVSLYFFDPTSKVLVPDPVFVPRGVDLSSILVRRLIAGPSPELLGYSRNLLPEGVDPHISVPVSNSGVATVDLGDGPPSGLSDRDRELLVAQLAWTLRQDTSVERLRVLVGGESITTSAQDVSVSAAAGLEFAPYVASADPQLYGLDDGRMVVGGIRNFAEVSGPFGQTDLGLRSITPDLAAERAAGVGADGSTLYVGPVRTADDLTSQSVLPVIKDGVDLLAPAWDFSGQLWIVDRNAGAARVSYLHRGRAEVIDVPLISGEDVKSFLVSRDGSRLVAVLRRDNEDEVVVSRLLKSEKGRFVRALPARQVDVEGGLGLRIKDIAWLSPTSIVVLHPTEDDELFQVRTASVDGAPGSADDLSLTIEGRVTGLAGTPNPGQPTYALNNGTLIDLSGPSAGNVVIEPGITSIGYVG
jgi:hypothetical protein